ncbi:MAG: acyl-CoA synthetase [Acidimicrobiia bacterium]
MNAAELLTTTATSYPDQVAWIWDGRVRTYREFNARADAFAFALADLGLQRGDRVALYLENCPEFMEAFFAVLKAGGTVVPLSFRFTADELDYHLADSGARILMVGDHQAEIVAKARDRLVGVEHVVQVGGIPFDGHLGFEELVRGRAGRRFEAVEVDDDEVAWLAYTSGTTGQAKGAMLTHGVLVFESVAAVDHWPLDVGDVALHVTPLTHAAGHNALAFTMMGCCHVLLEGAFDVDHLLDGIPRYRVNAVFLVPTMIKMVADHPRARTADLSTLRCVLYGGAPMYVEDLRRALGVFGPVLVQIYAQTESPMMGTILPAGEHHLDGPHAYRLGSCGRSRSGIQVRILDDQDRPVAPGERGEICIHGASVMKGYWHRPQATAEALRGGWLHTGDVGTMDDHGYVFILDRTKDMVISGGQNIYPREVEEVLLTHPAIAEACVFGIPDHRWGEAVTAHVVLNDGCDDLSEADIIAYAGEHLAPYKKPKTVRFVASLPKTAYGKLDKKAVRAPYWEGQERMVR